MPVSAQEHRVRTGMYNSGRGVGIPFPQNFHTTSNQHHKLFEETDSTLAFWSSLICEGISTFLKCCTLSIQAGIKNRL